MKSYEWNGHVINVEFKAMSATFWLGGGLVVTVGQRKFYPQLDGFSRKAATEFFIHDNGSVLHGVVQATGTALFGFGVKYSISIEDQKITSDSQHVQGWYLSCLSVSIFFVVMILAALGGCGVLYAIFFLEER